MSNFIMRFRVTVELRFFRRHPVLPDLHHALDKVCLHDHELVTRDSDA